jgi:hypothetical protein
MQSFSFFKTIFSTPPCQRYLASQVARMAVPQLAISGNHTLFRCAMFRLVDSQPAAIELHVAGVPPCSRMFRISLECTSQQGLPMRRVTVDFGLQSRLYYRACI